MIDKIKELIVEAENFSAQSKEEVEAFRIKYLGKKGLLNEFFAEFKNVANDQKKDFGQAINKLKSTAQEKVNALKAELENKEDSKMKILSAMAKYGVFITCALRMWNCPIRTLAKSIKS